MWLIFQNGRSDRRKKSEANNNFRKQSTGAKDFFEHSLNKSNQGSTQVEISRFVFPLKLA